MSSLKLITITTSTGHKVEADWHKDRRSTVTVTYPDGSTRTKSMLTVQGAIDYAKHVARGIDPDGQTIEWHDAKEA